MACWSSGHGFEPPLEAETFAILNGIPLHTATHHPTIVLISLKFCWQGLKPQVTYPSIPERVRKKREMIGERENTSEQSPPAPTASTVSSCPTVIQIGRTPRHQKLPIAQLQRPQHWNNYCWTHTYYGRTIASQLAMTREVIPNNRHHPTPARTAGSCPTRHNLPTRPLTRRGKITI